MLRPALPLLQRLRSRSRAQRRSAGLVITLILALLGGPAVSALRNECDLCPPTCPMHQHGGHTDGTAAPHRGCHAGPAGATHQHHGAARERSTAVGRATCGNHGVVPGTVLPPMLVAAACPQPVVAALQTAPPPSTARRGRLADPPDTPPPIGAA